MKQSQADRLRWILEVTGLSQTELEELTGLAHVTVWRYLTGRDEISPKSAIILAEKVTLRDSPNRLSPFWLTEGRGSDAFVSKEISEKEINAMRGVKRKATEWEDVESAGLAAMRALLDLVTAGWAAQAVALKAAEVSASKVPEPSRSEANRALQQIALERMRSQNPAVNLEPNAEAEDASLVAGAELSGRDPGSEPATQADAPSGDKPEPKPGTSKRETPRRSTPTSAPK